MNNSEIRHSGTEYLDFLSVISSIAVVYLHVNGCFWDFSATKRYWVSANIIEGVFYFAVPVFFMISGATLLDYRERYSTKVFFKKRIRKTVIPFIGWSLVGLAYRLFIIKDLDVQDVTLKWTIESISNSSIVTIYWFFPVLFSVYLAIPGISLIPKEKRKETFLYIIGLGFLLNYFLPFLSNLIGFNGFPTRMPLAAYYLMFPLTGYYLSHYDLDKRVNLCLAAFGVGGVVFQIIGTYYYSVKMGTIYDGFRGYENVPAFLYSVAVFIIVKCLYGRVQTEKLSIITFLKHYTFPIYLLHWFIYKTIMAIIPINTYSIVHRLLSPILIIAIVVLCTLIIRKIPIIKHLLP